MDKITLENVFEVDVPKLALDSRFGSLIFEDASKKLLKSQILLKEATDLNYIQLLPPADVKLVKDYLIKLTEHLEWLRQFDIGSVANAKQEHDNFNGRVESFYNNIYSQVFMRLLPFLREERRRERPDQKQLDEEITKVVQIRADLENELKIIKEETQKIRTADKKVVSAKGERAAVRMAVHFDGEVDRYEGLSRRWFIGVIIGYLFVLGVLIWLGVVTTTFVSKIVTMPEIFNKNAIWNALISKLVILAALWYGLSFIVKNYNVNSQLAAVNRHRAAVAKTLEDFVAVEQKQDKPRLSEILQNATDAMFKHVLIGFVSKTEKENSNPVLQIVNDLMGVRNHN
ncbi:MAG: hypothetical protein WC745_01230 [Patescibacteria group bacterium]|jgi:hypothetical protein